MLSRALPFLFLLFAHVSLSSAGERECRVGEFPIVREARGVSLGENQRIGPLSFGEGECTLHCHEQGEAELRCARSLRVQFSSPRLGVLHWVVRSAAPISLSLPDRGEEVFGVWENPLLSGGLSNRGVSAPFLPHNDKRPIGWASARAPFFFTNVGYGASLDTLEEVHFEFARENQHQLKTKALQLEGEFYFGTPREILFLYQSRSRRSVLPPDWAYGAFWWRNDPDFCIPLKPGRPCVMYDALKLRELEIVATALWIDRPFMSDDWGFGDRTFSETFGDPRTLTQHLKALGYVPLLWVANRFRGDMLREAKARGLLARPRLPTKEPALNLELSAAQELLKAYFRIFTGAGFQGFKLDRNDEGEFPFEKGGLYGTVLPRLAAEVLRERYGAEGLLISRAPFGSARSDSVVWSGDPETSFRGLRASLLALLRSGLILFPFSGSDTGGYVGRTEKELFIRWFEMSAYSPLLEVVLDARKLSFWSWADNETLATVRELSRMHHLLIPYTKLLMEENQHTGLPVVRPLFLTFPAEPVAWERSDEYLYGDSLLVAPVLEGAVRERKVYFPTGKWVRWSVEDVGEPVVFTGPGEFTVAAPLGQPPVFQRVGTEIPFGDTVRGNRDENAWRPWKKIRRVIEKDRKIFAVVEPLKEELP